MNQRPSGYEPDELPTALLRDIYSQEHNILYAIKECLSIVLPYFQKKIRLTYIYFKKRRDIPATFAPKTSLCYFMSFSQDSTVVY